MTYNPKNYTRCEKCKHIDRENEKCKITNDNWLVSDRAGTCHQFKGVKNMKVRCIDGNIKSLIKGNEYLVENYNDDAYKIINEEDIPTYYLKKYFKIVGDETENSIQATKEFEENVKKGAEMLAKCSMSSMDIGKSDNVNHPIHYNKGIEAIKYIESWDMNFNIGNVIKYVSRAKYKGKELEDLQKAAWYLAKEIERVKANV